MAPYIDKATNMYHIISKTSRAYTKLSFQIVSLILKTYLYLRSSYFRDYPIIQYFLIGRYSSISHIRHAHTNKSADTNISAVNDTDYYIGCSLYVKIYKKPLTYDAKWTLHESKSSNPTLIS